MKKIFIFLVFSYALTGLASDKFQPLYQADLPNKAINISYQDNGLIDRITVSSWNDRIKTDQGKVYRTFKQGFSYKKKQGFIQTYDTNGLLLNEKWSINIDGGIAQEEMLKAFELFKKNETVMKHFKETELMIRVYGGFNFADEKECKLGSRCVHVFASTPEVGILAHSIVRLTDKKVVYPDFDMHPKQAFKHQVTK